MRSNRKRGVLVVENLDETRELLGEFLMNEGYHSILAKNGHEALTRLGEIRPDVVVSDLDMPEMGGAELVRRMRADPHTKTIPIILLTGSEKPRVLQELGDHVHHVQAILYKPIKLAELHDTVEAALTDDSR